MIVAHQSLRIAIEHDSGIGHARRVVSDLVFEADLPASVGDRVALVITELATNLVRHAGEGHILAQVMPGGGGIELVAIDSGPGIVNIAAAMTDGVSSAGTRGVGLGAIVRAADGFDIYTKVGRGTVVMARLCDGKQASRAVRFAGVCIATRGETEVGDGWLALPNERGLALCVVDGLGHGPDAAIAARRALAVFAAEGGRKNPEAVGQAIHEALRPTRGAAIAITELDLAAGMLTFMGVGNIAGTIIGDKLRHLASHNGTAGGIARKFHTFTYPMNRDDVVVLMSDGIQTRWSVDELPGLLSRDPLLIAAVLHRDFARGTDDATVVVAQRAPA